MPPFEARRSSGYFKVRELSAEGVLEVEHIDTATERDSNEYATEDDALSARLALLVTTQRSH